jgi:outer membrane protein assembly factor BamB
VARIGFALLIGAAASSSSADTIRPDSVIVLPYGDIVIPVPVPNPPSNADPANPASPADVVTQRYNNLRTGTTLYGGLDQRAVSDRQHFGFLQHLDVDGVVLAQPLFVESVDFPQGRRPAVFIATSTNWVYAFDADTLRQLWAHRPDNTGHHLREPFRVDTAQENCTGQMALTEQDLQHTGPPPVLAADGIQSTPVIDVARSRIIVSYRGMDGLPDGTQRIAALDLRTGELAKGADGRELDRRVEDDALWNLAHRNRTSLLLENRRIYVAFAGRCEMKEWTHATLSYQGWIYAFDAATLTPLGRYRSTQTANGPAPPEATKDPVAGGGIWQASTGLAADGHGSL